MCADPLHVDGSVNIIYAGYEPVLVAADIEDDAITHERNRAKLGLEHRRIGPAGAAYDVIPRAGETDL
jgi:hypothetical protein